MPINVTRSSMPDYEEYIEEIKDLWDSRWLTNMGAKHQKLEKNLEEYLGAKNITLYTNGHLALENILEAYSFEKGSEIITTPFTFASTTNAIVRCGLIPVFCDIKESDYTINSDKIEELITDKTVAIMPVHVYGTMCDTDKIESIAKKHNLKVIYDAAHAFGVTYKGKSSAVYGDASMFSFHATKVFNTVEGGALCYTDSSLKEKLDDLKNFGLRGEEGNFAGGNAKMSEFHAAMGILNLRHLDKEIEKREKVALKYYELLSDIDGIKLLKADKDTKTNYAYFPVLFDGYKYTRDEIFGKLKENDIISRKYFYPITSEFKCIKDNFKVHKTPIAKKISENILCLPMYADLSIEDAEKIAQIILN